MIVEAAIEFAAIMLGGLAIAVTCGAVGAIGGEVFAAARRWFWRTWYGRRKSRGGGVARPVR